MLKVVAIADTHGMHRQVKIPKADILIHAGDISMMGELDTLLDFNDWLADIPCSYKIIIAGNHDRTLGQNWTLGLKMFTNGIYLQNSGIVIEGLKIWGSPYTPAFREMREGLTFYHDKDGTAMKKVWAGMPKGLDILVTHGPPLGVLDEVVRFAYQGYIEKENCGDGMLAAKVIQKKPKYHIFGHIHKPGKFVSDYGTTFINASVVDHEYNLVYPPTVIDIE